MSKLATKLFEEQVNEAEDYLPLLKTIFGRLIIYDESYRARLNWKVTTVLQKTVVFLCKGNIVQDGLPYCCDQTTNKIYLMDENCRLYIAVLSCAFFFTANSTLLQLR